MSPAPEAGPLAAWLALARAPGIGPVRFHQLCAEFGPPEAVLAAGGEAWRRAGLDAEVAAFLRAPDWDAVARDLAWAEADGREILTVEDPRYPCLLRQTAGAPPLLYVHGSPELLGEPQLAIVGSRNPTSAGRAIARDFAAHLAGCGFTITSGLAAGLDSEAHQAALRAGGRTIAVMGTGPDRIYPARNRDLARRIAQGGALVSEFAPGTPALPGNFPRRNRIISGLCLGVLVVEAAQRSGSLITARLAAEQGREVFAIPGSIHNPLSKGCHALIRAGATLVETAADIAEELGAWAAGPGPEADRPAPPQPSRGPSLEQDPDYLRLLEALSEGPKSVDFLVERCRLTADAISSMLLLLELEGYVDLLPGGLYSRLKP